VFLGFYDGNSNDTVPMPNTEVLVESSVVNITPPNSPSHAKDPDDKRYGSVMDLSVEPDSREDDENMNEICTLGREKLRTKAGN
jgi:hypothetical protein